MCKSWVSSAHGHQMLNTTSEMFEAVLRIKARIILNSARLKADMVQTNSCSQVFLLEKEVFLLCIWSVSRSLWRGVLPTEAGSEVHVRNPIWEGRVDLSTARFTLIHDLLIYNLVAVTKRRFYQDRFKYLHTRHNLWFCVSDSEPCPCASPDSPRVSVLATQSSGREPAALCCSASCIL